MKIAIAGYGNLGKSVEKLAKVDAEVELSAIISRRKIDNPLYVATENIDKVKADVLLLCLGSYADLQQNLPEFARFDTIDTFDDHQNMCKYLDFCNKVKPNTLSVVGAGWDPGIMSAVRGWLAACGLAPVTIWGKGQSLGHSNAIRALEGVIDAVQFTCPKPNAEALAAHGERRAEKLHDRVCYVSCRQGCEEQIRQQILGMPHYFDGYDVQVIFTSANEVAKLKTDRAHCGQIVAKSNRAEVKFRIKMPSNSDLTAQIMLNFAKKIPNIKKQGIFGAKTLFDLPLHMFAGDGLY